MDVKRKIVFPLILLTFGCAIGYLFGEIIAREFNLSKTWTSYIDSEKLMRGIHSTSEVGYTRVPDSTFIAARDVTYTTNHFGFRDINHSMTSKRKRIAFTGDSVTEGFGVEENKRYTSRIEEILGKEKVESMNFAVAGWATCDQLSALKKYILQYSPQALVLQVCANDFVRNMQFAKTDTIKDIQSANKNLTENTQPSAGFFKTFLQKHSAFYLFVGEHFMYYRLKNNMIKNKYSFDDVPADQLKVTNALFDSIHQICNEHHIPFLITYIPLEKEVVIKDAALGTRINKDIEQYCMQAQVPFIDATAALRSQTETTTLYLDDCHLSPLGNTIVAKTIIHSLKKYL